MLSRPPLVFHDAASDWSNSTGTDESVDGADGPVNGARGWRACDSCDDPECCCIPFPAELDSGTTVISSRRMLRSCK